MAEILAAAEALQKEFTTKFEGLDARVADIEKILGVTLNADGDSVLAGKIFQASVNDLIANSLTAKAVELLQTELGLKDGKLVKLEDVITKANNNALAIQAINDAIDGVNNKFTALKANSADGEATETSLDIFVKNIGDLAAQVKANTEAIAGIEGVVENHVNNFLAKTAYNMITSINLYANQHQAMADEYGKVKYTNGTDTKYPFGFDNFDHELNFVYTIESGIYDAQLTGLTADGKTWRFPDQYIRDDIDNTKGYTARGKDVAAKENVNYFEFVDGRYRSYEDSILVRVSPTNADLTKADIALLNSTGVDIIDYGLVELFDVKPYTRTAPLTRAATGNSTGLWVIKFKLNEAEVGSKWLECAMYNGRPIVYAVAVKTTQMQEVKGQDEDGNETVSYENENGGVDRYVVSEYDLSLATTPAKHGYTFDVNKTNIEKIHNRYIQTEEAQVGETRWTDDKELSSFSYELVWKTPCKPDTQNSGSSESSNTVTPVSWWYEFCSTCNFNPTGEYNDDCYGKDDRGNVDKTNFIGRNEEGYTYVYFDKARDGYEVPAEACYADINAADRVGHDISSTGKRETTGRDNRHLQPFLPIQFDKTIDGAQWAEIEIEFPAINSCGELTPMKGFFVTLDQQFSKESGNSEINAWWHYIYKNVALYSWNYSTPIVENVTLQKGNKGYIYIKDDNNIKNGDVIGFRVHAVNLDGTLYDPDGRAFYVMVGKQTQKHELSFDVTVTTSEPTDSAWAVQNPNADGLNPIKAYNDEQKANGVDDRFFNRQLYKASYKPEEEYRVVYTWREDNPEIKALSGNYAMLPVAGSGYIKNSDGSISHGKAVYKKTNNTYENESFDVENFFDFKYSENADADIEDVTDGVENNWAKFNEIYPTNKVAANRLTQSVKATIRPAAVTRLLDGKTYMITAMIQRYDGQTDWTTVNTIDIDIKKVMPTAMPKAFSVKDKQLAGGNWQFYMRPFYKKTPDTDNTWKITWGQYALKWINGASNKETAFANNFNTDNNMNVDPAVTLADAAGFHNYRWTADVRPWTFDEIFNGILLKKNGTDVVDTNYYFVFQGAGDFVSAEKKIVNNKAVAEIYKSDDAYKNADAIALYGVDQTGQINPTTLGHQEAAYRLPLVHWSHLGGSANVKAGYIYRNISATLAKTGNTFLDPDGQQEGLDLYKMKNSDYKIDAVDVKVEQNADGSMKADGATQVTAKFDCAFTTARVIESKTSVGSIKNNADTCIVLQPNEDAKAATFNLVSNKWTSEGGDAQAYFDTQFPTTWKSASKVKLSELIAGGYLWLDYTSITFNHPDAAYKLGQYREWYFADASGNKIADAGADNKPVVTAANIDKLNTITQVVIKRYSLDQGLGDLKVDSDILSLSFDVYDMWFHKNTVTVSGVKILAPTNQNSRQAK
jgi:hypothetical protein